MTTQITLVTLLLLLTLLGLSLALDLKQQYNKDNGVLYAKFSAAAYCHEFNNEEKFQECAKSVGLETGFTWAGSALDTGKHLFGFVAYNVEKNLVVVSYRGTLPFCAKNWGYNLQILRTKMMLDGAKVKGVKVHEGFLATYGALETDIMNHLDAAIKKVKKDDKKVDLVLTGHSLGGSMATIAAIIINNKYSDVKISVYTYGSPRVGNADFVKKFKASVEESYRIVHHNDGVPMVPPAGLFHHVPQKIHYNADMSEFTAGDIRAEVQACSIDNPLKYLKSDFQEHQSYFVQMNNLLTFKNFKKAIVKGTGCINSEESVPSKEVGDAICQVIPTTDAETEKPTTVKAKHVTFALN